MYDPWVILGEGLLLSFCFVVLHLQITILQKAVDEAGNRLWELELKVEWILDWLEEDDEEEEEDDEDDIDDQYNPYEKYESN